MDVDNNECLRLQTTNEQFTIQIDQLVLTIIPECRGWRVPAQWWAPSLMGLAEITRSERHTNVARQLRGVGSDSLCSIPACVVESPRSVHSLSHRRTILSLESEAAVISYSASALSVSRLGSLYPVSICAVAHYKTAFENLGHPTRDPSPYHHALQAPSRFPDCRVDWKTLSGLSILRAMPNSTSRPP